MIRIWSLLLVGVASGCGSIQILTEQTVELNGRKFVFDRIDSLLSATPVFALYLLSVSWL